MGADRLSGCVIRHLRCPRRTRVEVVARHEKWRRDDAGAGGGYPL
jgi:hypothetical protein